MTATYLNALGLVNALGCDQDTVFDGLLAGSTAGMQSSDDWVPGRSVTVGQVPDSRLPEIPAGPYRSRNNRLLLAALTQIESEIVDARRRYGASRIGIVLGTSTSGIAEGEAAIRAVVAGNPMPPDFDYRQQELASPAEFARQHLGLHGPCWTVSTACTSSAKALAAARRLLDAGICDAVIAGGVDSLCGLTLNGFHALESVATGLCRPFSANRDGINIGEAAAVFLMTREPGPVALLGAGESSDAYHISGPDPSGAGASLAIKAALQQAHLEPAAIDYINLHGTGTLQNDAMEAAVVARLFPDRPPVSSTKPLVGHTLGAAGATEAALCWLLIERAAPFRPPHVWDDCPDPEMPALDFATPGTQFSPCRMALSNSFAFGGNNACLILGSPP